jgi:putative colanic acid biosynthesis UDP-glucose lipid carrier transferase
MNIFEKIFQRNDKFFLLIYYLFLSLSLYLSSTIAYYIRNQDWNLTETYIQGSILITLIFLLISIFNSKEDRFIKGPVQWFRVEFVFLIQTFFIAILLTVIFKVTESYSRVWLFTNIGLSIFVFLLLKIFFDFFYSYLIKSNSIQRNVIIVGDAKTCQSIIKNFPKKKSTSVIKCIIAIDQQDHKDLNFYGIPSFSLKDDYAHIFNHHSIGQIWIVSSVKMQSHLEELIDKFMNFSVDCRLILPESKFKFIEGLDSESGFDFYNVSFSPFYGTNFLIKNIMDKILALFFLLLTFPIIIIFSVLIIIENGFPIFFKQKRTGWDGRSFYIYKLRSLIGEKKTSSVHQVTAGDNRLLTVGKIIRRLSIDELPQFFNVLKGDMSIVGPRPHPENLTRFASDEVKNFMQRHKCLPGITGWAQVNGLRGPTIEEGLMNKRFQHDLYYIKNWNLMLDFYIMIKTFFVILTQKVD